MKLPIETAIATGKIVEATLYYSNTFFDTHDNGINYYVSKALELQSLGIHILALYDITGELTPNTAYELISAIKSKLNIPVHFHTCDLNGNGIEIYLKAVEANVDIIDLNIESMCHKKASPSMNKIVSMLQANDRSTEINIDEINKLNEFYTQIKNYYKESENNNIEEIILKENINTTRPGETLPYEDLEALKKFIEVEYNFEANYNNILSYVLFADSYNTYYDYYKKYGNIYKLESDIFFYGLNVDEESTIVLEEDSPVNIKYVGVANNFNIQRKQLIFEVNGVIRVIEIKNNSPSLNNKDIKFADFFNINQLGSPIKGSVLDIHVKAFDTVKINSPIVTIKSMKLETIVVSATDGVVSSIEISKGDSVEEGELIAIIL